MDHKQLNRQDKGEVALYALGALEESSARQVSEHLAGCHLCTQEHLSLQSVLALLPYGLPQESPSPTVKTSILERVRAQGKPARSRSEAGFINLDAYPWRPTEYEGVSIHTLREDPSNQTLFALVKLQQGANYPNHLHLGSEDCLVLRGALRDEQGDYAAGSFVHYGPGTQHRNVRASGEGDCVLLISLQGGLEVT